MENKHLENANSYTEQVNRLGFPGRACRSINFNKPNAFKSKPISCRWPPASKPALPMICEPAQEQPGAACRPIVAGGRQRHRLRHRPSHRPLVPRSAVLFGVELPTTGDGHEPVRTGGIRIASPSSENCIHSSSTSCSLCRRGWKKTQRHAGHNATATPPPPVPSRADGEKILTNTAPTRCGCVCPGLWCPRPGSGCRWRR